MMSGNRSAAPTHFSASVDGCVASVVSLSSFTAPPASKWSPDIASTGCASFLVSHKKRHFGVNCVTLVLLIPDEQLGNMKPDRPVPLSLLPNEAGL